MSQASEVLDILSPQQVINQLAQEAKAASTDLIQTTTIQINDVLASLAENLSNNSPAIIIANQIDIDTAKRNNHPSAILSLIDIDQNRIDRMVKHIQAVRNLPDIIGQPLSQTETTNGVKTERVSVPIGLIGVIYETSPDIIIDAVALCLKSRNSLVLCGTKHTIETSKTLHKIIQDTLRLHGLAEGCVSMAPTADSDAVDAMLSASLYIDVMIPHGNSTFKKKLANEASMPVFSSLSGPCHIYIHSSVTPSIAREVVLNAKMHDINSPCAVDTLLIDKDVDQNLAQEIIQDLIDAGCDVVGDKLTQGIDPRIGQATQDDWRAQYLDKKISCAIVSNVKEAIAHINGYSAHHSDCILAQDSDAVDVFTKNIDSAIVLHNTSTQLSHGYDLGMGADIGIATGSFYARGPIGLEQLCTNKYIVRNATT